ncbi:MAG: hypothetical protein LCH61_18935 [Proteobacteria bacterium]|nr:hypothetical protein [Pseudomonadota bacterium]
MIALTFDTDHMSDAQMRAWLKGCRFPGRGTFFCTEAFHFLADAGHEVAPHPFLGDKSDWEAILREWRETFPKATCWRAHSLVFSQYVGVRIGKLGYTIASTVDTFGRTDISPFFVPWGVWQMPIYYMDNNDFNRTDFDTVGDYRIFDPKFISQAVESEQVLVFDFHPIHYELNTPNYAYYVERASAFKAGEDPAKLRYDGYGARSFFDDLVAAMDKRGLKSLTLPEALGQWQAGRPGKLYSNA